MPGNQPHPCPDVQARSNQRLLSPLGNFGSRKWCRQVTLKEFLEQNIKSNSYTFKQSSIAFNPAHQNSPIRIHGREKPAHRIVTSGFFVIRNSLLSESYTGQCDESLCSSTALIVGAINILKEISGREIAIIESL